MRRAAPGPAPVLALALALAACGSEQWREADGRLHAATASARQLGYAPLSGPYSTFAAAAGAFGKDWQVALDSGADYAVGAACTSGCDALVLVVKGPDGRALAADTAAGTAPVAFFTAPARGSYTVALDGRCSRRCRWVAQVYERGAGRTLRPGLAGGRH